MTCPLVLDANALISFFDGSDDDLEQALCRTEVLIIPIVSYAEVMAGADSGTKRGTATLDALSRLLAKPNTRLLPVKASAMYTWWIRVSCPRGSALWRCIPQSR